MNDPQTVGWVQIGLVLLQGLVVVSLLVLRGQFASKAEVGEIALRLARVEQAQGTMPTQTDIHEVALKVSNLGGDVKGLTATVDSFDKRFERIESVIGRVEEYLLDQAGSAK